MRNSGLKRILSMLLIAAMVMVMAACGKSNVKGSGAHQFKFVVVDAAGTETDFEIKTDKATVGEALVDEKLIEGTESAYGLYVTKVNGIEAIYENDGTYWAFYVNGEYASTGVDSTNVEDGATYMFKVEK